MFPKRVHFDRLPLDGSGRLCCGGIKSLHEFGAKGADKHCVFAIFDAFQRTINIPGMMISRMGGRPEIMETAACAKQRWKRFNTIASLDMHRNERMFCGRSSCVAFYAFSPFRIPSFSAALHFCIFSLSRWGSHSQPSIHKLILRIMSTPVVIFPRLQEYAPSFLLLLREYSISSEQSTPSPLIPYRLVIGCGPPWSFTAINLQGSKQIVGHLLTGY